MSLKMSYHTLEKAPCGEFPMRLYFLTAPHVCFPQCTPPIPLLHHRKVSFPPLSAISVLVKLSHLVIPGGKGSKIDEVINFVLPPPPPAPACALRSLVCTHVHRQPLQVMGPHRNVGRQRTCQLPTAPCSLPCSLLHGPCLLLPSVPHWGLLMGNSSILCGKVCVHRLRMQ